MDCHMTHSASWAVLYNAVNCERVGPCFPADLLCLKCGTKGPIKKSINKVAGGKHTHTHTGGGHRASTGIVELPFELVSRQKLLTAQL